MYTNLEVRSNSVEPDYKNMRLNTSVLIHYHRPSGTCNILKMQARSLTADVAADARDVSSGYEKNDGLACDLEPVRISLFVSAAHTKYDLHKAYESQKEPYGYTPLERMEHNISILPLTNYDPKYETFHMEMRDSLYMLSILMMRVRKYGIVHMEISFPVYAEHIDAGVDSSPSTAMLSEVACSLKNEIVDGSILERCGDKMYNTCYYSSSLHKKVYECGQMQGKRKIC
nr:nitrilase/cyanide hydratase and apolipoprotein N-acyltransferase family protein [Tanacetum cinerariifolium]